MTTQTEKLLPCPFCGGDRVGMEVKAGGIAGREATYNVRCHKCRASCGGYGTYEIAAYHWNSRTPNPSAEQPVEMLVKLAVMNVRVPGYPEYTTLGELYGEGIIENIIKAVLSIKQNPQPNLSAEQPVDSAAFWRAEYCSLARAAVEKMAELGVEVDPAEKMIEAAEYRQSKLPARESQVNLSALDSDDAAFEAFMLAHHENGGTGLGFRKSLQAYRNVLFARLDSDEVVAAVADVLWPLTNWHRDPLNAENAAKAAIQAVKEILERK